MAIVELECFCGNSKPDPKKIEREEDGDNWCTLKCGHIMHNVSDSLPLAPHKLRKLTVDDQHGSTEQACIYYWARTRPSRDLMTCPYCLQKLDLLPSKPGQPRGERAPRLIQLYFPGDAPQSDPASQFSDPIRPRVRIEANRAEVDADDDDELAEASEEEEPVVQPGMRGQLGQLDNLRQQTRELGNTLRDVKAEKDRLKDQLVRSNQERNSSLADVARLQTRVDTLTAENGELKEDIEGLGDQIAELEENVFQLQEGQPNLRGELEEAQVEIADLEEVNLGLEGQIGQLKDESRKAAALAVEEEDKWRAKMNELKRIKKRLEEQIQQEGNSGAMQIKLLKEDLANQEKLILKLRCDNDRLELTTKETVKELKAAHFAEITAARSDLSAAEKAQKLAKEEAQKAQATTLQIKGSIESWRDKCDKKSNQISKLQQEIERLKLLAAPRVGIVSSPEPASPRRHLPRRPSNSLSSPSKPPRRSAHLSSPTASPPPFKIKAHVGGVGNSNLKGKRKVEVLVLSDSDEEEEEKEDLGFVTNKNKRVAMPGLLVKENRTAGNEVWGVNARTPEMTKLASDQHMPRFRGGGVIGGAPKTKVKVKVAKK